jgi:integral membrane protein (TIGR00529 family)
VEREILALIISVVLIVLLVRFRVDLGVSMLAGAATLALVVGRAPLWTLVELGRAAIAHDTLLLLARIITIMALSALAGKLGYLDRFASGLRALISDNRIVIALIPAFGGMLPMPGGTMLTAPMVESAVSTGHATPEQKLFVSYWFRHVWEYIWPLYPGVVVGAALVNRPVSDFFLYNWPITLAAIASGAFFVLRRVDAGRNHRSRDGVGGGWKNILIGVWPFGVVVAGVLVLEIELILVILAVIVVLVILERPAGMDIWRAFRRGTEFQIVTLIVGVAAYQHLLGAVSVVDAIPPLLLRMSLPEVVVIAVVPMIIGLVTGVTLAFIAVSFPLLIPLMGGPDINMELVMLGFASGFVGCLLSPVHLCLVITREYFGASWGGIYRMLLPACAVIMVVAALIVLL